MIDVSQKKKYLFLTIKIIKKQLKSLKSLSKKKYKTKYDQKLQRELKSPVDRIIERDILKSLYKTNINILSEETGFIKTTDQNKKNLRWIVDPLDGTVNFTKDLGYCGISIALFENNKPIFGVIGVFPSGDIYYGGSFIGSYHNDKKIYVSNVNERNKAIICTGFPARYNFKKENFLRHFFKLKSYAKVRMLGSASVSLIQIAKGSAEVYYESEIMLWDIAAGMAILQGAGGKVNLSKGRIENSHILSASNGKIKSF